MLTLQHFKELNSSTFQPFDAMCTQEGSRKKMQPLGDGTGTAQPQPLVMACNHFVNQLPHWHCFPPKGSKFIRTSTPSAEAIADHVVVVAEPQHQLTAQVFAVEVAVSLENLSTSKVWRWRWRSA